MDNNLEEKVVVEVKDLYKIYKVGTNKVRALNGVSFTIYEMKSTSLTLMV